MALTDTTTRTRSGAAPNRWWTLAVLILPVLLLAIDTTVLVVAVPSLTASLDATGTEILWIGDIYSIGVSGFLVFMGSLGDRIGRKRLLLIGSAVFGLASVAAALATTAQVLILARLLMGIAGATLMPSTLSIIRNTFLDAGERTRAIAIWSAAWGAGSALGPLLAGFLLEHFWWGSVFLVNVPVMMILLVAGLFILPESRDPDPGPFDVASSLLSMAAILPLVYAIKHTVQAGPDGAGLSALAAGLLAGWLFVRRQRRMPIPMIDIRLFRNPAFSATVLANFIAMFALSGLLYFYSQYLQLARGFTPLTAGLAELPTTVSSILAVLVVGWLLSRLGDGRSIAVGLGLVAIGLVAVSFAEGMPHFLWLALALVPVGLGNGIAGTVTTDAVVSAVPPQKAGAASAISETSVELGSAMGVAVLGSLLNGVYQRALTLPEPVTGTTLTAVEDSLARALSVVDPASATAEAARAAFNTGMQVTALAAAVCTAVAALVAWKLVPSVSRTLSGEG